LKARNVDNYNASYFYTFTNPKKYRRIFFVKNALDHIIVKGARQHNLKNIDLQIPKNKLVIFTGVSGSGKSSLAMDTIYAEGQRRYVESLSAYARQFLGIMDKPEVDKIDGLSPAIAIDQKTTSRNPRSTVGTITEIYDYMRLLYARVGHPHCPNCGREIQRQSVDEIVNGILNVVQGDASFKSERGVRFIVYSPIIRDRKGEYSTLFENLKKQGIIRARIDGIVRNLSDNFDLIKTNKHSIDGMISRHVVSHKAFKDEEEKRNITRAISQSVETALRLGNGSAFITFVKDKSMDFPENPKDTEDHLFSENFACPVCNISLPDIEPRTFSFNSPHGACAACDGLGTQLHVDESLVINKDFSIEEGGVLPWVRLFEHYSWTQKVVEKVAKEHNINLKIPFGKLPKEHQKIILFGIPDKRFKVTYTTKEGREHTYDANFEGVIPNLERRHKETESDFIRGEIEKFMVLEICPECKGSRLKKESLSITVADKNIWEISRGSITNARVWVDSLEGIFNSREKKIGENILKEITYRLKFLVDVGLDYLTIERSSAQLSGGEAQRIRLASQIGSGLSGVLYVLDEPSIGLHQKDQSRLINTLHHLRDLGNTVLVVEHDAETMLKSDYIFDFGPGAGSFGGNVIAHGTPEEIMKDKNSITGQYLSGKRVVGQFKGKAKENLQQLLDNEEQNISKKSTKGKNVTLKGASGRNLKNVNLELPLGKFICVTGVSGSGKSTLIMDTLHRALRQRFGLKIEEMPEDFKDIDGIENISNVIAIEQTPIGRTPKSNPATYTKVFDHVRELFAMTQEARVRGYAAGRFSFNVKGGRCEACGGDGQIKIEMQFMPDVYVNCEVCGGKRYNREALEILYKGKNISEVLDMTVSEALTFFEHIPQINRKIQTLEDVGLGYIKLGQPATTLSGGEAQRIKLASELSKRSTGSSLYILDEPTTGLHFADLENLITIFKRFTARGNTVLVIEHNLDVIANADWAIDLGPDGGDKGGEILFNGSIDDLKKNKVSYTAEALREHLKSLNLN
jgi:excinuclease ABC subunit A